MRQAAQARPAWPSSQSLQSRNGLGSHKIVIPKFKSRDHAGFCLGFRSGLEEKNASHLKAHGQPVLFETFKIPYIIPESWHTYTPDFRLPNGIIVETKGRWVMQDRAKMLFVKLQYPDLDIRLVFQRGATPISQGAKTTCAQWAAKHGFKWAEKLIPIEWTQEPGPEITPEEALKKGPAGDYGKLLRETKKK